MPILWEGSSLKLGTVMVKFMPDTTSCALTPEISVFHNPLSKTQTMLSLQIMLSTPGAFGN